MLNFNHGSFSSGEFGRADGSAGNDTINVRTGAFIPAGLEFDVGGVNVQGGDGSDEINITYQFNDDFDPLQADQDFGGNFARISDFDPTEDTLVVGVDRNGDTTDRDISVELDQSEENGTFTSLIILTFAETDQAPEATNILRVISATSFTLDDIQLVGI